MPHTTPRLLASTTRRWPPICRQNLGGGERGRERGSQGPSSPFRALGAWAPRPLRAAAGGRAPQLPNEPQPEPETACTDSEPFWAGRGRAQPPPAPEVVFLDPARARRPSESGGVTGRQTRPLSRPGRGRLVSRASPWSLRALGDLLGADRGAPCSLQGALLCSPPQNAGHPRTLFVLPPWAASCHLLVLNAAYKATPLPPQCTATVQQGDLPGAQPGVWSSWGSSHRPEKMRCLAGRGLGLRGPFPVDPQPGLLRAAAARPRPHTGPAPGPAPERATADSHLVTRLLVLRGFQVWAGVTHEDVPLAGDGPDGLRGGAAEDLAALAAGQVEQGQLAWADGWSPLGRGRAAGRGRGILSLLPLDPWPAGTTAHSPSRSCPARWRRPGAPATAAGSSRGCTGRRSVWSR